MYKEQVMEVLERHFGTAKEITESSHFLDDLNGDDFDIVDVVDQVCKKLDIMIPEEETFDLGTVQDLLDVVEKHIV
ncbi:MAG: phosphopantetheine-binding protein [Methylophagaceae bacterium]|jgi:acyl carrier protein|tara:strand:+ start:84 stop:311 length:228 start_codon:yes stop_codon:yes gene_type:complete